MFLPNITAVKLPDCPRDPTWVSRVLLQACGFQNSKTSSPHSLSKLQDVELSADSQGGGDVLPYMFLPFLELRSLRRFTCPGLWMGQRHTSRLKGIKSHVTHLSLPCSD